MELNIEHQSLAITCVMSETNCSFFFEKIRKATNYFQVLIFCQIMQKGCCWHGKYKPFEIRIHFWKFLIGKETLRVLINFVTLFQSSYSKHLEAAKIKYPKLLNHWYFQLTSDVTPLLWQKVIKVVRLVLLAESHMLRQQPIRAPHINYWQIRRYYVLSPAGPRVPCSGLYFINIML